MKLRTIALALAGVSTLLIVGSASAQAAPAAPPSGSAAAQSTQVVAPMGLPNIHKWAAGTGACPTDYFCIWRNPNFEYSEMYGYWKCATYSMPFHTIGSWYNNQTNGARAVFYTLSHKVWGVTGGWGAMQPGADFRPTYYLDNC